MPYVFRQGDLPKLDLNVDHGTDFKAWKAQWEAYFSLSGLDGQSNAKQVQALTLCFSRETVTIVDNLGLTTEQLQKTTEIIAAIERYVQGQINESVERRNFRRRVQQEGETFDDFLVSLRELAKTCSFCSDQCTHAKEHPGPDHRWPGGRRHSRGPVKGKEPLPGLRRLQVPRP